MDISYVQGMSYLAATLLLHLQDEYLAFKGLANLLNKQMLHTFYTFDMETVNKFFDCFMRLLNTHVPVAFRAFDAI